MKQIAEEVPVRAMQVGAEYMAASGGTHFRVWAPKCRSVSVVFEDGRAPVQLESEDGYHAGFAVGVQPGDTYKYAVGDPDAYPDPASRYQPTGPHGYSAVVDPNAFRWTDSDWRGCKLPGQVIYELHLGTFTPEGTWTSAEEKLPYLKETGITVIELMPVADFPGRFGWGYDGVQLFAPASIYGTPDDARRFVNRAHELGIAVILDVVYNHLGPDGNYLSKFSDEYFSTKHKTDWGAAINYDGPGCPDVREFFLENAAYWIREFHVDGLRLDATQDIHDDSCPHILSEMSERVHAAAAKRGVILIGENEPQDTTLLRPVTEGGGGLDGLWNDDYHHSATVALNGSTDAYYADYKGSAQEFVSALKYGYLFQGQWYRWQKKRRGRPAFGLPRPAMITFIQNHDQIANSGRGLRCQYLTSPGKYKALTALTLLGPGTPMLFQGQEFASSAPFFFFADHRPELAKLIRKGRAEFLEQWRSLRTPEMRACFADPSSESTFERCKLDFAEVERHSGLYQLHCDLLRLRREDPVISQQGAHGLDGAVLGPSAFVVRFFSPDHSDDRLLVVNLEVELEFNPSPEPLLAAPWGKTWQTLWASEHPNYDGCGAAPLEMDGTWRIPGQSAVLLRPAVQLKEDSE